MSRARLIAKAEIACCSIWRRAESGLVSVGDWHRVHADQASDKLVLVFVDAGLNRRVGRLVPEDLHELSVARDSGEDLGVDHSVASFVRLRVVVEHLDGAALQVAPVELGRRRRGAEVIWEV